MDDVFSYEDMQDLVKTIDAEQDPIPTRWLNAILGRVFFGLYRTAFVEEVSRILYSCTGLIPVHHWANHEEVE
jgi:hypothetical protein